MAKAIVRQSSATPDYEESFIQFKFQQTKEFWCGQ